MHNHQDEGLLWESYPYVNWHVHLALISLSTNTLRNVLLMDGVYDCRVMSANRFFKRLVTAFAYSTPYGTGSYAGFSLRPLTDLYQRRGRTQTGRGASRMANIVSVNPVC